MASKILAQVDAKLLGSVMNLASKKAMGEVGYGYGRSYGYSSTYQYYGEGKGKQRSSGAKIQSGANAEAVKRAAEDPQSQADAVRPARALPPDEA